MICVSYTRNRIMFGESISITEQNEKIAAFVKSRRMTIDKKFSDRSEDVNADEGFLEMKEAGINRQFDCVVFWSMMYFGNDPLVGYNLLLHTFIPAGIDFAVVCDNFFSLGHSAEEIEEYLRKKYKERRLAHGLIVARYASNQRRNTLYGYEKHGDEFIIDKTVEPIVRELFKLALDGASVKDICEHFNKNQVDCPQVYLRKVVDVSIENVTNLWDRSQVKKILTDTRYMGERIVNHHGKTTVKPIEAYITRDEYDRIQASFYHFVVENRNKNPFSKIIYDKDSHERLYMGDYMSNGTNCYYLSKRGEEYRNYKKKVIEVHTVMDEVKEQLNRGIIIAKHVERVLKSESGQAEISARKENLMLDMGNSLENLLDAMDIAVTSEHGMTIGDDVKQADSCFGKLVERKKQLDTALSVSNPWLTMFSGAEEIDDLMPELHRKYISEILVDRFETVILIPKYHEWKELLPQYWLEV